jgi:nitroimidazol reductase NimA-like FMN-containing flavoprotein (pyridoxamine 5'-phosphate oxidase superfamily)
MAVKNVATTLDQRFSSDNATATSWTEGRQVLEEAEIYWLTTVRPGGRPHVTPLMAHWLDGALYFTTGPDERKAKNLARNRHCVVTTGCNVMARGLDVVLEGDAVEVRDEGTLQRLVGRYASKYGWQFSVRDGAFFNDAAGQVLVFAIAPETAFGFGRGDQYSQTRWRF